MREKGNRLCALMAAMALLLPVRQSWAEPSAAQECVALAKRQGALFSARAKSDWNTLYGFILPAQRTKISLDRFMANPHEMPSPRSIAISGARTPAPGELPRPYLPAPAEYRIVEFRLSADGTAAMVHSKLRTPAPPGLMTGMAMIGVSVTDFWRRVDGEWFIDMEAGDSFHASGAQTAQLTAHLTAKVNAEALANQFLSAAAKLSGAERQTALDHALWVDTFGTVRRLAEIRASAGTLPAEHLKHIFAQYEQFRGYYEPMIDMGDLFALAGDHETAYEGFLAAHLAYGGSMDALGGAVKSAMALERWQPAADHFLDLMQVASRTGKQPPETLEPLVAGVCPLCAKLPAKTLRALADGLLLNHRADLAAAVYGKLLVENPGWADAREKLNAGNSAGLEELLGPELKGETTRITFGELGALLGTAGIALIHPDDAPDGVSLNGNTVTAMSLPALEQVDYSNGYSSGALPASARIEWHGGKVDQALHGTTGGWATLFVHRGKLSGAFYKDNDGGSAKNFRLTDALGTLKKGSGVILARLPAVAHPLDEATVKMLGSLGVDTAALGGRVSSLVVFGKKGAKPGTARLFSGDGTVLKTFLPSNTGGANGVKGPSIAVSGLGARDTARYKK